MRWALSFALLGAVGCSKVQLPNLGKPITINDRAGKNGTVTQANGTKAGSNFEKGCQELPGLDKVPMFSVEQYPALIAYIKQVSPLISEDEKRIARAHAVALKATNAAVFQAFMDAKMTYQADFFKRRLNAKMRFQPNVATDLSTILKLMKMDDRSPCASAYLSHFYSSFVKALDPMGEIVFGLTETHAPSDTLGKEVAPPADFEKAPADLVGGVLLVSLPQLQASPALDEALIKLQEGQQKGAYGAILFDLRSVGGSDLTLLARIQTSAARGWGSMPIVLWVDRATRGTAALAVVQLASRPNVLVIGAHEETYGYGRKLVQKSATLVDGLLPMTLTIGSELLQPYGLESRADGYQFRVRRDGKDRSRDLGRNDGLFVTPKDALERAGQWKGEAQVGVIPVADLLSIAPTEALPAVGSELSPPAQPEESTGGSIFGSSGSDQSTQQQAPAPDGPAPEAPVPLSDQMPTTF